MSEVPLYIDMRGCRRLPVPPPGAERLTQHGDGGETTQKQHGDDTETAGRQYRDRTETARRQVGDRTETAALEHSRQILPNFDQAS